MIHLCAAQSLIFQEAVLEFFVWWCQDSRKWQGRASPNMQAFFRSLLVSHFSVIPLVKVSPESLEGLPRSMY